MSDRTRMLVLERKMKEMRKHLDMMSIFILSLAKVPDQEIQNMLKESRIFQYIDDVKQDILIEEEQN